MTVGVTWYLRHSFKSANQSEARQEKYPIGPIWVFLQRRLLFFQRVSSSFTTDKTAAFLVEPQAGTEADPT